MKPCRVGYCKGSHFCGLQTTQSLDNFTASPVASNQLFLTSQYIHWGTLYFGHEEVSPFQGSRICVWSFISKCLEHRGVCPHFREGGREAWEGGLEQRGFYFNLICWQTLVLSMHDIQKTFQLEFANCHRCTKTNCHGFDVLYKKIINLIKNIKIMYVKFNGRWCCIDTHEGEGVRV